VRNTFFVGGKRPLMKKIENSSAFSKKYRIIKKNYKTKQHKSDKKV